MTHRIFFHLVAQSAPKKFLVETKNEKDDESGAKDYSGGRWYPYRKSLGLTKRLTELLNKLQDIARNRDLSLEEKNTQLTQLVLDNPKHGQYINLKKQKRLGKYKKAWRISGKL